MGNESSWREERMVDDSEASDTHTTHIVYCFQFYIVYAFFMLQGGVPWTQTTRAIALTSCYYPLDFSWLFVFNIPLPFSCKKLILCEVTVNQRAVCLTCICPEQTVLSMPLKLHCLPEKQRIKQTVFLKRLFPFKHNSLSG